MGPANGLLGRAQRLLDREQCDCVERGYLMLPALIQSRASGDHRAAHAIAASATEIGERFGDADLVALAAHEQGHALVAQGRVQEGLGLLGRDHGGGYRRGAVAGRHRVGLLRRELGLEAPAGGILHVAGPGPEGGWRVIESFLSEEDASRFLNERFAPALRAVGFSGQPPQPQFWPVHNHMP
jgi:hypothetical protein